MEQEVSMLKFIHLFIGLLVTLVITGTALAQEGPITPRAQGDSHGRGSHEGVKGV
jgi:hypothetical protein